VPYWALVDRSPYRRERQEWALLIGYDAGAPYPVHVRFVDMLCGRYRLHELIKVSTAAIHLPPRRSS